jgi:hypothetical protein
MFHELWPLLNGDCTPVALAAATRFVVRQAFRFDKSDRLACIILLVADMRR